MPVDLDARIGRAARETGEWTLVIGVGLTLLGLGFGFPLFLLVTHRGTADVPWLALTASSSLVLGFVASWWLKRRPRSAEPISDGHWQVGRRQAMARILEERASKVCLVMALVSYYGPALFVVVVNQGWGSVDTYLHGHLLDGFTFIAFLTVAWALVLRDFDAAVRKLVRFTAVIAVVAVYLADGRGLEIVITAIVAETFSKTFWTLTAAANVELHGSGDEGGAATGLQAVVGVKEGDRLSQGEVLKDCESLFSVGKKYVMIMLHGELSVWEAGQDVARWSSGTWGSDAQYAELDADGRLVLRGRQGAAIWATGVPGGQAEYVIIQNDGRLVAFQSDGTPTWAIGTTSHPYSLTDIFFLDAEAN